MLRSKTGLLEGVRKPVKRLESVSTFIYVRQVRWEQTLSNRGQKRK